MGRSAEAKDLIWTFVIYKRVRFYEKDRSFYFGGSIEITDDERFVSFEGIKDKIGTNVDFSEWVGLQISLFYN